MKSPIKDNYHFSKLIIFSLLFLTLCGSIFSADFVSVAGATNWESNDSWVGGVQPDRTGTTPTTITLNSDMTFDGDLWLNLNGSELTTINLNGHNLNITGRFILVHDRIGPNDITSNVKIVGPGKFDVSDSLDVANNGNHNLTFADGVEFSVAGNVFSNCNGMTVTDATPATPSSFVIPGSGINVSYGQNISFNPQSMVRSSGDFGEYSISANATLPTDTNGKIITISTVNTDNNRQATNFAYSVSVINSDLTTQEEWTLDDMSITDGSNGTVTLPNDQSAVTRALKCTTAIDVGDGIAITFKTPDGLFDMAEIRYVQGETAWTGAVSSDVNILENWTGIADIADLANAEVTIPAGCTNSPILTGNVSIKSIKIQNNAKITVNGGTLTTSKIEASGSGKILAESGTVEFSILGDATDTSFSAESPTLSKFGNFIVNDSFQPSSDIYIFGNFTNNTNGQFAGNGTGTTVYIKSAATCSITNNAGTGAVYFDSLSVDSASGVAFIGNINVQNDLTLKGNATVNWNNNISAKNIDISSGVTFNLAGNAITCDSFVNKGTIQVSSATANITASTFDSTAGTVEFVGFNGTPNTVFLGTGGNHIKSMTLSTASAITLGAALYADNLEILQGSAITANSAINTENLQIAGNSTITLNANAVADNVKIASGSTVTINSTNKLTVSASWDSAGTVELASADNIDFSGILATSAVTDGGSFEYTNAGEFSIAPITYKDLKLNGGTFVCDLSNFTVTGKLTNDADTKVTTAPTTFSVESFERTNSAIPTLTVDVGIGGTFEYSPRNYGTKAYFYDTSFSTGILQNVVIESGTLSTENYDKVYNATIKTGATLELKQNSEFRLYKDFTNSGSFIAGTNSIFYVTALASENTTKETKITGNNTFDDFYTGGEGKVISFEAGATQTINGEGYLYGDSPDPMTLKSTVDGVRWKLITSGSITTENVKIKDSECSIPLNITNASVVNLGNTWNWFLPIFVWKGTTSSDWSTASNWTDTTGFQVTSAPPTDQTDTIIKVENAAAANALKASANLTVASIQIAESATFDLGNYTLKINPSTSAKTYISSASETIFANNGTLKLAGNQTIDLQSSVSLVQGTDSTVEYSGATLNALPFGYDYAEQNLVLSDACNFDLSTQNVTAKTLTLKDSAVISGSSSTYTVSGDCTLANTSGIAGTDNTFTVSGDFALQDTAKITSDTSNFAIAGNFLATATNQINSTSSFTCANTVNIQNDFIATSIETTNTASTVTFAKKLTVANATIKASTLAITGDFTVSNNASITATTSTFGAKFDVTKTATILANSTFNGTVQAESFTITGNSTLNGGSVTTATAQEYNGSVTFTAATTTLTQTSTTPIVLGGTANTATVALGANSLTITGSATVKSQITQTGGTFSTTGDCTFNKQATVGALTVGGNAVFNGIATLASGIITGSATFANTATVNGDLTVAGDCTFTGESTITGNTTVTGDCQIKNTTTVDGNASFLTVTVNASGKNIAFKGSLETSGALTVTAGTCTASNLRLDIASLSVANGASFTQTGLNTAANVQNVGAITANGTVTFDSNSQGGYLTLGGNITGSQQANVNFNKKEVSIANNCTLSGIFYDLTIPAGMTVTNGNGITVRRNFTVETTGTYTHNDKTLTLGGTNSENGTITVNNASVNLGTVSITQGTTSKTFTSAITAGNITVSAATTGTHAIQFNEALTANQISGTAYNISFAKTADIGTLSLTRANNITFGGNAEIPTVNIARANDIAFSGTFDGTSFRITQQANNITFGGNAEIATVNITRANDIAFSGTFDGTDFTVSRFNSLTLKKDTTIANAVTLSSTTTAGNPTITFGTAGDNSQTFTFTNGLTISNRIKKTSLAGTVKSTNSGSAISISSPISLIAKTTITTNNAAVTFGNTVTKTTNENLTVNAGTSTVTFAQKLTTSGDSSITASETTFNGAVEADELIVNGDTIIKTATIKTATTQEYNGDVQIQTSTILTQNGTTPIKFAGTTTLGTNLLSVQGSTGSAVFSDVVIQSSGNFSVSKDCTFNKQATVGALSVGGKADFNGIATLASGIITGSATFANTATVNGDLTVGNAGTSTGDATFTGNANVTGKLTANAKCTFSAAATLGSAEVKGIASFAGEAEITGNFTAHDDCTFTGKATIASNLLADKKCTFLAGATLNNIEVTGICSIDGETTVNGNAKFSTVTVNLTTGNTTFNGTLTTTGALTVEKNACRVSNKAFDIASLTVKSGTSFTQTGLNTAANVQKVGAITAEGQVTFDSTNQGGTLTLAGNISGAKAADVLFNKKNVTIIGNYTISGIFAGTVTISSNCTLSGIFYDLTIPAGITVTNGNGITVRRNFTVETTATYTHNDNTLTLGSTVFNGTTYASETGTINVKKNGLNLGTVQINQDATSKTFASAITAGNITVSAATTGSHSIQFNEALTANQISGTAYNLIFAGTFSCTSFTVPEFNSITFEQTTTITDPVDFSPATTKTRTITLGKANVTTGVFTFTNGLTIGEKVTKTSLAGTVKSTGTPITVKSPVSLIANTTINTNNADVTFTKAITKSTSGSESLTVNAGTGAVSFESNITSGNLSVTNTNAVKISGAVNASDVTVNSASAIFESDVTSGDLSVTNTNAVKISGAVNASDVTVNSASAIFESDVTSGDLSVTTTGTANFAGDVSARNATINTGTSDVTFAKKLTTTANATLSAETATFTGAANVRNIFTIQQAGKVDFASTLIAKEYTVEALSNKATYTGDVTFTKATIKDGDHEFKSKTTVNGDILVQDVGNALFNLGTTVTGKADFTNTNAVTFNSTAAITGNASLNNLTTITFNGTSSVGGTATFTNVDAISFNGETTINSDLTFTNTGTTLFAKKLTSGGNISLQGTAFTFESDIDQTTNGKTFTANAPLTLGKTGTAQVSLKNKGNVTVKQSLTLLSNLNLTSTGAVLFETNGTDKISGGKNLTLGTTGKVDFKTPIDNLAFLDVKSDNNIEVNSSISVTNYVKFNSKQNITINDTINASNYIDFTATNDITTNAQIDSLQNINFTTTKNITTNAKVNSDKNISFDATENITTNAEVNSNLDVTFTATKDVMITARVNSGNNIVFNATNDILINNSLDATGKITLIGKKQTIKNNLTCDNIVITNSGLLLFEGTPTITATNEIVQNGSGNTKLKGTFNTTNKNASFASELYIYDECTFNLGSGKLVAGKNIFVSAIDGTTVKDVSFTAGDITVAENFALFNGNVSLNSNLTVTKDIVLLNGNASTMYNDSESGVDGLFFYHLDGRLSTPNLSKDVQFDGLKFFELTSYNSTLTGFGDKQITTNKNIYNNGVNLTPASTWNLSIPDTSDSTTAFAEFYNATIANCNSNNAVSAAENCTDNGGNTNVYFGRPSILVNDTSKADFEALSGTYTVFDNVIRIEFVDSITGNSTKIENSNNEISAALANIKFDNGNKAFIGAYTNKECTISVDGKGDLSVFYLKVADANTWNTDATGLSDGFTESTNAKGEHKSIIPNIHIAKAVNAVYGGIKDEHKNRIGHYVDSNRFTETADRTTPVLIEVSIGQESHTDGNVQEHYDSHNFIEFVYSEPVDIESMAYDAGDLNIKATETLGKITNNANGFNVSGLGTFEQGSVVTGSRTAGNTNVLAKDETIHAFYRNFAFNVNEVAKVQKCRIRMSIAGYVDGSVNYDGNAYNYWPGFIYSKETSMPSGSFTPVNNANIKDLSTAKGTGNGNTFVKDTCLAITVNAKAPTSANTLYGMWDISAPALAVYKRADGEVSDADYEILSADLESVGRATAFEMHFLDNEYFNNDNFLDLGWNWRTRLGWYNGTSFAETLPRDLRGGSRFDGTNKTRGGIRVCSLFDSEQGFSFENTTLGTKNNTLSNDFSQKITSGTFFGSFGVAGVDPTTDIPYASFKFNSTNDLVSANYTFEYKRIKNGNTVGFITDLAGNLLEDFSGCKTPDKTPPKLSLSVAEVNGDKLFIVFSKQLDLNTDVVSTQEEKFRRIIKSIKIVDDSSGSPVDTGLVDYYAGSRAKKLTETMRSSGLEISLTRPVTYDELKNLKILVDGFDSTIDNAAGDGDSAMSDPVTGRPGTYSLIYDLNMNTVPVGTMHSLSDFAVNALDVLYAYDGRVPENAVQGQGLYVASEWAVRDFTGTKTNYATILANQDITISSKIVASGTQNAGFTTDIFKMVADIGATASSKGDTYEYNTGISSELWFIDNFLAFSSGKNTSTTVVGGSPIQATEPSGTIVQNYYGNNGEIRNFVIPNNSQSPNFCNYGAGSTIQFLFKVYDKDGNVVMVDANGNGTTTDPEDHPLYVVRLSNPQDLSSVALWTLELKDLAKQVAGVTIMNNVINATVGEEAVLEVKMPQDGSLTVQVLTADGDVVKTLQRGRVTEGDYIYKWNGTNNAGNLVARGMYFVRVVGTGIDETRKIMVVRSN